jgi:hypothetical protein
MYFFYCLFLAFICIVGFDRHGRHRAGEVWMGLDWFDDSWVFISLSGTSCISWKTISEKVFIPGADRKHKGVCLFGSKS